MSLSSTSSVRVDANPSMDTDPPVLQRTDPVPGTPPPADANPPGSPIAMNSRKRLRDDMEGMQVDGVDSDDSSAEGAPQDSSVEEPSSEPAIKRRRVGITQEQKALLQAAREQISEALRQGDLAQLEALLDRHPDCLEFKHPVINATPLLEAVWWGKCDAVRRLLERGANPDVDCEGFYGEEVTTNDEFPETLRAHATTHLMHARASQGTPGLCGEWGGHVLWHTPLAHAAGHRAHAMLQLLLEHGATPGASALSAAVLAKDLVGMQALLAAGGKPADGPVSGPLQNASSFALAICIDWGWEELLAHLTRTLPPEALANVLGDVLEYCIEQIGVPLLQRLLRQGFMQVAQASPDPDRIAPGKNWLVASALRSGNGTVACWLLQQGFAYTFDSDDDAELAAQGCRKVDSFVALEPKMASPHLRERMLHWCLWKNLMLHYEYSVHNLPEEEFKRWLVEQGASPFFSPSEPEARRDHVFHLAVATDDIEVVQACFARQPRVNFHLPGLKGLYPVEIAAERKSLKMVNLLLNREVRDGAFFVELYAHVVTKVRRQNVAEGLFAVLRESILAPARAKVFEQLCKAGDWKSLEFMLTFDHQTRGAWFGAARDGCPEPLRSQLGHVVMQADLLEHPRQAADAPAWKAPADAGSALTQLGREAMATGTEFATGATQRFAGFGLAGEISASLQPLWHSYGYLRAALIDVDRDAAVAGLQFASFAGHWLATTPAHTTWLNEDMSATDGKDLSQPLSYALTDRIVTQVTDLRDAGKSRATAWAMQLPTQLPMLCVSCVDAETERVDVDKAEQALKRLGVFGPNARPLAIVLQRAYAAVVSSGTASSSTAGSTGTLSQLYRGFAERLLAEIRTVLAAPGDVGSAQTATAEATRRLSQDDYQRLHGGGQTLTAAFIADATQRMAEMIGWQMDVIVKAFGVAPEGRANSLDRKMMPFERFAQALPTHARMLEERRFEY